MARFHYENEQPAGRDASIRMEEALGQTEIAGVQTTLPLFQRMVVHPDVRARRLTTAFLEDHPEILRFEPAGIVDAGLSIVDRAHEDEVWDTASDDTSDETGDDDTVEIRAEMPGVVEEVLVTAGDRVSEGSPVVVIEAMKMFCNIESTADGVVTETIV